MNRNMKPVVALATTMMMFAASQATAVDVNGHYKVGIDAGGDTLVTVTFTDGSTENIKANNGLFFGGGVSIISDDKTIETEVALTYKVDDITASNGDATWSRWPIDALVFYRWDKVRLGGGLTYHLNPKLDGSGIIGGLNVQFDDALGAIAQIDWRITSKMNLGLRYTALDYKVKGGGNDVGSNGLGLVFSGNF